MTRHFKGYMSIMCIVTIIGIAGCKSSRSGEDTSQVMEVQKELTATSYTMDVVRRGDISNVANVNCVYLQMKEQNVVFGVDDKVIFQVYVDEGESVKKGDLLISLDVTQLEKNMRELEYSITYEKLMLEQTKELQEFDVQARQRKYDVSIGQITDQNRLNDENQSLMEDLENINKSYLKKIEDYEDQIAIDELKLNAYKEQYNDSMLYAEFDGTVSYIKDSVVGSLTKAEERVMTIIDDSICSFVAQNVKYMDYFSKENEVTITTGMGDNKKEYAAYPVDIGDTEENTIYFELVETAYDLDVGTSGKISIVLESKEDVLYISKSAVHTAGEDYYVYVTNEDGLRTIQYVEVGIFADKSVEIVSGLEEGDYVIIK